MFRNLILAFALAATPAIAPDLSARLVAPPGGGCVGVAITQELASTQACLGETIILHVVATGSNLQYSWTHGGVRVNGATTDTLTLSSVTLAERGIWCVQVFNECSSVQSCCRVSITDCGGAYCTLTQGAYGNPNGQWNGMNRVELITSLLASGPLVVGEAGRSLTISPGTASAQCIIDRLPSSDSPATLPDFGDQALDSASCQTNPPLPEHNGRFKNTLLGQTITLSLNLRLDPNLGTLVLCNEMTTSNGVFLVDADVIEAMVAIGGGHGVANLLELANHALAGLDTNGVSLSLINGAVDSVNRAFDECAVLEDCN